MDVSGKLFVIEFVQEPGRPSENQSVRAADVEQDDDYCIFGVRIERSQASFTNQWFGLGARSLTVGPSVQIRHESRQKLT